MAKIRYESGEADGATAIGHELDTKASLVTAGAKLLSVANAGVEEFAIDKDGTLISRSGSGQVFTFLSRQTENSVQSAYEFRCNPVRSTTVPQTIWYNGNPGTVMMSLNPIATGSMLTFLLGGGICGNTAGLYGGTGNSIRFPAGNEIEVRADTFRILSDGGGDGTGDIDLRGHIKNSGTGFSGRLGFDDNIQFGSLGGQGPSIYSNESSTPGAGAFNIEAMNDMTSAPDTRLLAIRQAGSSVCYIDAHGNLMSVDGWNMQSQGTDTDPGFASGVLTVINNSFDSGDNFNIVTEANGTFTFTETTDFTVGGSPTATASNIVTAINNRALLNQLVFASSVGAAVTITALYAGSLGNRIHLYESDGATDNFTLSGLTANNRFTGGTDNGTGLTVDTKNTFTNDAQRRLLTLRSGQRERFAVGGTGYINVRRTSTGSSVSSAGEVIIGVTNTASPRTITLDTDDLAAGRIVIIKDESGGAGTNNITILTEGGAGCTIDGVSGAIGVLINAPYGTVRLYSDGANWFSW